MELFFTCLLHFMFHVSRWKDLTNIDFFLKKIVWFFWIVIICHRWPLYKHLGLLSWCHAIAKNNPWPILMASSWCIQTTFPIYHFLLLLEIRAKQSVGRKVNTSDPNCSKHRGTTWWPWSNIGSFLQIFFGSYNVQLFSVHNNLHS